MINQLVTLIMVICSGGDCRIEHITGRGTIQACQVWAIHIAPQVLRPGERLARAYCEDGVGA